MSLSLNIIILLKNEKEKQLQSAKVKALTQDKAILKLNQQRQWIYIIGGFVVLALGSLYFIYRSRLRSMRLETQLVKERAAQEKKRLNSSKNWLISPCLLYVRK